MRRFRQEFPRLYELKDCIANPKAPKAYFQNLDENLADHQIREVYLRWERILKELDHEAWKKLKTDVLPRLTQRDRNREWQALFDTLGEARGYAYLEKIGCSAVRFVPRSSVGTVLSTL